MRRLSHSLWLAPALLALLAGSGPAQTAPSGGSAPKKKSQLEEWLDQAASRHPDIKVAEAKLREALAELDRARSGVVQKVVTLHHALEAQRLAVDKAAVDLELIQKSVRSKEQIDAAQRELILAKARLAELEDQMKHLVGQHRKAPVGVIKDVAVDFTPLIVDFDRGGELLVVPWVERKREGARGPMAERIRKALEQTISLSVENESVDSILRLIGKQAPDLVIQVKSKTAGDIRTSGKLTEVPLGAALQWVEDCLPEHRVVVREYGLLIAPESSLPPSAMGLSEFLKSAGSKDPKK